MDEACEEKRWGGQRAASPVPGERAREAYLGNSTRWPRFGREERIWRKGWGSVAAQQGEAARRQTAASVGQPVGAVTTAVVPGRSESRSECASAETATAGAAAPP